MSLCPVCATICVNNQAFEDHLAGHTGETYVCEDCGKNFKTPRAYYKHYLRCHNKAEINCNLCSEKFQQGDSKVSTQKICKHST